MSRVLVSRRRLRWPLLLTLLIGAVIAWGTLTPPGASDGVIPFFLQWGDKPMHALGFALLILPLACKSPSRALRAAPFCLAFGGLIELIQPYVGRSAEWGDLAADGLGLLAGLALGMAFYHVRKISLPTRN